MAIMNNSRLKIDRKQCIFCNLCNEVAEEAFCIKGNKSAVKDNVNLDDPDILGKVKLAIEACPVQAISMD